MCYISVIFACATGDCLMQKSSWIHGNMMYLFRALLSTRGITTNRRFLLMHVTFFKTIFHLQSRMMKEIPESFNLKLSSDKTYYMAYSFFQCNSCIIRIRYTHLIIKTLPKILTFLSVTHTSLGPTHNSFFYQFTVDEQDPTVTEYSTTN